MAKLLAAVNLPQVGEISIIEPDPERGKSWLWSWLSCCVVKMTFVFSCDSADETMFRGLFSIQLNSREYILRVSALSHFRLRFWVSLPPTPLSTFDKVCANHLARV